MEAQIILAKHILNSGRMCSKFGSDKTYIDRNG